MAATKIERRDNLMKWRGEPVIGNSRFTPCVPMEWVYELPDIPELVSLEEEKTGDELKQLTPPNVLLRDLARQFPPPSEWFEEEENEPPF